jgi:hypothetical protein
MYVPSTKYRGFSLESNTDWKIEFEPRKKCLLKEEKEEKEEKKEKTIIGKCLINTSML